MAQLESNIAEKTSERTTRFVCISDTHDCYDFVLPEGEILLHAGDFTNNGTEDEIERFLNWLKTLKQYRLKIFIVGNHESKRFYTKKRYKKFAAIIEQIKSDKSLESNDGIVYLEDRSFYDPISGLKFYGSGWLSEYCKDPKEIQARWSKIPDDTDVLLTHGPPNSILDRSSHTPHLGCKELFNVVTTRVKPKLHLFGHVHGAHGTHQSETSTFFINAAICDSKFRPTQSPILFDLQK